MNYFIKILLITILFPVLLNNCGTKIFKRSDVKDNPVNVEERVKRNIEEGRGVRFGFGKNKSGGTFDFASSNELWRATIEVLDFVPLVNASYSGGIVITDWFNREPTAGTSRNRDLKITVRFLSNEIRSDALDVKIHERICDSQKISCSVSISNSVIPNEIKVAILKKAAFYEKNKLDKVIEENKKRPKKIK